jgi:hypothetical protein
MLKSNYQSKPCFWSLTCKHFKFIYYNKPLYSPAIAQVVSCCLPTEMARVRARISLFGICGGQAALGQVFSEYLGFPCHSFIPLIAPQSPPSIIQSWYSRPINDRSNRGLVSTPASLKIEPLVQYGSYIYRQWCVR